jgi:general secretion pathway protein D
MPILKHLRETLSLTLVFLLVFAPLEARTKKGEKLLKDGQMAEARREYDKALELFEQALNQDPTDQGYQLAVRRARFQASQSHVDLGQKLRQAGKLEESIAEFQKAFSLDPSSTIAEQELRRTFEMIKREKEKKEQGQTEEASPEDRGLTPGQQARKEMEDKVATMLGVPDLKPSSQRVNLKLNNQPVKVLWETLGKVAGINVMFDQDFITQSTRNYSYEANNIAIEEVFDNLAVMTKAYWKPLTANSVFVTQDNVTKRRDYEEQVVKTFYLQNVTTPQELQEIATVIRTVTDIRRLLTYNGQMAMTIRGSVDQISLAQKVILDLDKAKAEVVIDVFVMEANRVRTRDLAAAIASAGAAGFRNSINFTPRNPVLTGGSTTPTDGTPTTPTTPSTSIALSQIGRISTNDYSVANMPGLLLNAVMNDRMTRVLQNPSVRTLDSQKVTLKIGDKYPYATGSFQPGVGAVGVSPLVSTQFQFADVGVNIDLTPKIHGGEEVTMHIEIEVSNIRDNIDVGGLKQPVIGTRRVNEDVRVKEGEVTLLGGLTTLNTTRTVVGIPGLANIPGLRWLGSTEGKEDNRSELLIALVPRIVRAAEISDVNMRGISAGNDQVVKISYAPKAVKADAPAPGTQPAAQPPVTQPQLPPALQGGPPEAKPTVPVPGVTTPPVDAPPAATPPPPAAPPAEPAKPAQSAIPGGQAQLFMTTPAMSPRVGGLVSVTVQMVGATDLNAAPMKIRYDPKLLKLIEVANGNLMGEPEKILFSRNLETGAVRLLRLPGAGGVTGGGTLVTITFMAVGAGSTTIGLDELQLENSKREPIAAAKPELSLTIQ